MDLQGILDRAVARGAAPGLTAAVRRPGGELVSAVAGRAGGGAEAAPMTRDTRLWIASCTKALSSVAALQLVEAGVLDLDAPLAERLPALVAPMVLESFDAAGAPVTRAASRPLTLRALLSHTSGYGYDFFSADLQRWAMAQGRGPLSVDAPLMFEPGERWSYGIGIDVAGLVIEAATGKRVDEVVAERILEPLGMTATAFFPAPGVERGAMAQKLGEGVFEPIPFAMPAEPYFGTAGGGLYSTATDYLKFLDAILARGAPLIAPETFAEMMRVQPGAEDAGDLTSVAPSLSNDYHPLPGQRRGHGLAGLVNLEDAPGRRRAGSLAWAGLSNCYYWADPSSGAAGVVMAQVFPFADPAILAVFDEIEAATYAA